MRALRHFIVLSRFGAGFVFCALLSIVAVAPPVSAKPAQLAARVGDERPTLDKIKTGQPDFLVTRLQKALTENGLYSGPVDGYMNKDVEEAIRAYQKNSGLKVNVRVTRELVERLETGIKVGLLLQRLETAKSDNIKAARAALMSRPETRELLRNRDTEAADPTRDPAPCFKTPTARCLLDEAAESTKAIFKPEMRDWALGEVLVSQARAGFVKEAMNTVSRINDPRLVMVALRDIAKAQASAGRDAAALAAAEIIPDTLKQVEAYAQIAAIQAKRGRSEGVKNTIRQLLLALEKEEEPLKRISFRARVAVIMSQAGDWEAADANLKVAETLARSQAGTNEKKEGLRHIASALAKMEKPERALMVLKETGDDPAGSSVLVSAAAAQARAGDASQALSTAEGIEVMRYRAVVLSQIAAAQLEKGDHEQAIQTLQKAMAATKSVKRPFALDFALGRIVLTMTSLSKVNGDFSQPLNIAGKIKDNRMRAHILWSISAERRRAGDAKGSLETENSAKEATAKIKSALSQVWMFSEIAIDHLEIGETGPAWAAFWRAMPIAGNISNSWGRARALSRLAATMIELGGKTK
ncbi:MAG: peptidoglycan-binding domain-containing protein [Rhodospirillales bacterium]